MKRALETRAIKSTVKEHRVFREDILALKSSISRQEVGCDTNKSETCSSNTIELAKKKHCKPNVTFRRSLDY